MYQQKGAIRILREICKPNKGNVNSWPACFTKETTVDVTLWYNLKDQLQQSKYLRIGLKGFT